MVRPLVILFTIFIVLLSSVSAWAEGETQPTGLDGQLIVPAPQQPSDGLSPVPADAPPLPEEEPPPPQPKVVLKSVEPFRFKMSNQARFQRWINDLCKQDALEESPESLRVRYSGAKQWTIRAERKEGSLRLLLENYAELADLRDNCKEQRKKHTDACVQMGPVPKPWKAKDADGNLAWMKIGSQQFWTDILQNRSPAGIQARTDLLRESQERVTALLRELKQNFTELSDFDDFGQPGSGRLARRIAETLRHTSHCQVMDLRVVSTRQK